ncbi:hypothetical protein ACFVRR_12560 [Gottfriedia sp. NPDC057948]|uniref:hypothetical protein n=1 Tax=Gottfriedia sp. NPDC057948 TaxID=3346287 RepID=UPI0036DEFA6B
MKKIRKIITGISLIGVLIFTGISTSARAEDIGTTKPKEKFGDTSSSGYKEFMGPWKDNKWNYYCYNYQYKSWDDTELKSYVSKANTTMRATTSTTYSITGSTEFGFKDVAKVNLSGTIGKTWGKEVVINFNSEKGWTYHLWAANKVQVKNFKYVHNPLIGSTKTYKASAIDKVGTTYWAFKEKTK